jgi:hypothetical protein
MFYQTEILGASTWIRLGKQPHGNAVLPTCFLTRFACNFCVIIPRPVYLIEPSLQSPEQSENYLLYFHLLFSPHNLLRRGVFGRRAIRLGMSSYELSLIVPDALHLLTLALGYSVAIPILATLPVVPR